MTWQLITIGICMIACCSFGAWSSYAWKEAKLLPLYMGLASAAVGVLWGWLVRVLNNDQQTYLASYIWDITYILAYALIPVVCFGVRLDRYGIIGVVLLMVGMLLLHISSSK